MNIYFLISFVAYFIILLTIGLVSHKKQNTSADFIMGSRSLNFWLVALSAHASDMSAWLFMALPMTIFVLGLPHIWIALGLIAGMFLNWQFVAPKLRTMTEKYGAYTLSTFFERRFTDHSGAIRILSALMIVIFLTHYLSAGLIAMGFLFESLFNIDYLVGLSISMLVVVIYTFYGGFITVAWTDLFQGIFLLFMIALVPIVAYNAIDGGFQSIQETAKAKNIPLSIFPDLSFESLITTFSLALGWGLGYFGMPHVITKFMGIRNASELYKSKWLGMSWQVIALGAAAIIGLIGIAYFPEGLAQPEMVFVEMVKDLFHPLIAGFILCAVLAANMSTMDSQILVCASVLSEDLYKHLFKKEASSKSVLLISRIGVVLVTGVALLLALNKSKTILDTVLYSWSGLGSAFGPLVLMSLYYTPTNKYGALAGIVTGGLVVLLWSHLNPLITSYKILPMIPGFFCSALAIFLFSHWTAQGNEVAVPVH
jgi:sodium/proline symporter